MDSPTDRIVLDSEDPIDELADALHELQLDRSDTESPNRIMSLAQTVVTSDTIEFFMMHYEAALIDWIVTTTFQTLDTLISGTQGKYISRLAHVQLLRVFDSLEDLVAADRSSGSVRAKHGLTNLSIVIDLYQDAQTTRASRCRLHEKRRAIKRYAVLAGPSPIILLLYTDVVDKIVKDFATIDENALRLLAFYIHQNMPPKLLRTCIFLAETAEWSLRLGQPYNICEVKNRIAEICSTA
ncbi:hypothetical protein PG993_010717 [Apiospora rasikravindrae]|uniref:Uncharacterized protein n=1 Tax=Apiospora rasikravindrae TaxID=990691 RepID=A0ABR1SC39_9PEZI